MLKINIHIDDETRKAINNTYGKDNYATVSGVVNDIIDRYLNAEHFDPKLNIDEDNDYEVCEFCEEKSKNNRIIMSINRTKNKKEPRQYFSDENATRCDAIRQKIESWKEQNLISDDEYYFLITSLVESIDKYANTASVYGAFLKKLKKTAQNSLILKPAELIIIDNTRQIITCLKLSQNMIILKFTEKLVCVSIRTRNLFIAQERK